MNITKKNMDKYLLKLIPSINSSYKKLLDLYDGKKPGSHIVFGDLLNPYLIDKIKVNDELNLIEVFKFLEDMANSSDEYVREVLAVTVLERLSDDKSISQIAKKYMGLKTLEIMLNIERNVKK